MAKILADIGRSDLPAVGRDLLRQAVDIRREETDLASDLLTKKMQIGEYQTRQAAADRKRQMDEFALRQAEEAEKVLNRQTDVTVNPIFLSLPEEMQNDVFRWGASEGYWDEQGQGTVRSLGEALQAVETTKELSEKFFGAVVEKKKNAVLEAWEGLTKAQESGDEEKVAKARSTYNRKRLDYEASRGKLSEHLDSFTGRQPEILGTSMQPFPSSVKVAQELGISPGEIYYTYADKTGNPMPGAIKMSQAEYETSTGEDSGIQVGEALDKLKSYRLALARLEAGQDIGTDIMAMISPETQALLKSTELEDVEMAKEQLRLGVDYYSQYVPEKYLAGQEEPMEEPPLIPAHQGRQLGVDKKTGRMVYEVPGQPGKVMLGEKVQ